MLTTLNPRSSQPSEQLPSLDRFRIFRSPNHRTMGRSEAGNLALSFLPPKFTTYKLTLIHRPLTPAGILH